jgi:hypothetical protein
MLIVNNFISTQNAQIVDVKGLVQTELAPNSSLQAGDKIAAGSVLSFSQGSEITLSFDDGSQQRVVHPMDQAADELSIETIADDGQITAQTEAAASAASDNVENDIAAIQALIESGDDIELPDTAAGGLVGNEGGGFVTLARDGEETLAKAGFDTNPLENTLAVTEDRETLVGSSEPTITQSDNNVVAEDTTAFGNVLDNDSDLDDVLSVQSFTVAGDPLVYLSGQTASVEGGSLTVNVDGSYAFIPATNYNGELPLVSYTTNTNATDTLAIIVTPVSDLLDGNESVITNEDTAVSGNLLANASSADGTPVVVDFTVAGTTHAADGVTPVSLTQGGVTVGNLTVSSSGAYTFTPTPGYSGPVPTVSYAVFDGVNNDTSTLTIAVTDVNNPPVAADDNFSVNEGETVSGNVISHDDGDGLRDTDGGDGAALAIKQVDGNNLVFNAADGDYATVAIKDGVLRINAQGDFTYENEGFLAGSAAPTFNYTLSDGTDTDVATVNIAVITHAPDAIADNNYIVLNEIGDTDSASVSRVKGNVVAWGSSSDNADTSVDGFGSPVLTQVEYAGTTYIFDAGHTSQTILTDYGSLTINNAGRYLFATTDGMPLPAAAVSLAFTYTIQDGDTVSPETDSADLTINIAPPATASGKSVDLDDSSSSIDTFSHLDGINQADKGLHADSQARELNLSDLFADAHSGNLDKYLAFDGEDETSPLNTQQEWAANQVSVEAGLMLEKVGSDSEYDFSATVKNGLFAGGAILISDAAAAAPQPLAELDSTELF